MSSRADMIPGPLVRHVERSRSLHETVILLIVRTAGRPSVPGEEHYQVEKMKDGYYRVVADFGFMEEPNVMPVLQAAVKEAKIPFPADEVTYYLGRENFIATSAGSMGGFTESLFAFKQVVELGTQLDL